MPSSLAWNDGELVSFLEELSALHAPSGYEAVVNDVLIHRWRPYVESATIDTAGNLVAEVGGSGPRVALVAHSDEICLTVREVRPDGFLAVVGGQRHARETAKDYAIATGQVVTVITENGSVPGVLGARTGHLLRDDAQGPTWEDMFVDIGVESHQEAVELRVRAGCPVVWSPPLRRVGRNIVGKAMDNRIAIAIQDALLRRVKPEDLKVQLVFVSTAREEYGLIGASALDRSVELDAAIVLDVGPAGDTPAGAGDSTPVSLGGGPILVHKDGGTSGTRYDRRVTSALEKAADEAVIALQHAVFGRYGTDGGALMQRGVPTAVVAVPTRFTHSPVETVRSSDVEECVRLLTTAVASESLRSVWAVMKPGHV
jgi:tetrahedral aminopeptidase